MACRQLILSNVSILAMLTANASAGGIAPASDLEVAERQASLPAVSGLNAKLGGFGANFNDANPAGAFAALSLPLARDVGLQVDGVSGTGNGGAFYGVGAHLFWRDPSRGLFGGYASHFRWDAASVGGAFDVHGAEVSKWGFEGQLYLGRLSLEGVAAYQFGSEDGFAGKGTVAYYPHGDLRLHLTVSHLQGPGFMTSTGFEWAPLPSRGVSLFADIGVDEDRDFRSMAGLKFYFSRQDKTLIRRHREDDPDVELPNDLFQTIQARSVNGVCPNGRTPINGFCDGNT